MENRTNQVVELEDGKEYFVLRQIAYKGDTYYVTTELLDGKEKTSEDVKVLKESIVDGETYLTIVTDAKIIEIIYNHLN